MTGNLTKKPQRRTVQRAIKLIEDKKGAWSEDYCITYSTEHGGWVIFKMAEGKKQGDLNTGRMTPFYDCVNFAEFFAGKERETEDWSHMYYTKWKMVNGWHRILTFDGSPLPLNDESMVVILATHKKFAHAVFNAIESAKKKRKKA